MFYHMPSSALGQWRVIHLRIGGAVLLCLDSEGVFEFFHAGFEVLDFAPLLFQEQVFDSVEALVGFENSWSRETDR
jgi:hypothetical protein